MIIWGQDAAGKGSTTGGVWSITESDSSSCLKDGGKAAGSAGAEGSAGSGTAGAAGATPTAAASGGTGLRAPHLWVVQYAQVYQAADTRSPAPGQAFIVALWLWLIFALPATV